MSDTVGPSGVVGPVGSSDALERGRSLVLAAFDEARATGREDWHQMTTAVLKNRLLNSTHGEFDEKGFGVFSMVNFVQLFPGDLEVDTTGTHPLVRFKRPEVLPEPPAEHSNSTDPPARHKIRPDLWRAAVDYRSGSTYVWDKRAGLARVADPGDTNPVLSTVTAAKVAEWRQEFADSMRPGLTSDKLIERLDEWLRHGYATGFLPAELRGRWNEFSRGKVDVWLRNFFADRGIAPPRDLIIDASRSSAKKLRLTPPDIATDVSRLRELVQRCVAVMTEQELMELRISPVVMLRATRGGS